MLTDNFTGCRCKELQSIRDFVHDSELKELSTSYDPTAQQQRACERGEIFRHFSRNISCLNILT